MAGGISRLARTTGHVSSRAMTEPAWVRRLLIGSALLYVGLFLLLPLASVFVNAFAKGFQAYVDSILDPTALSAIRLTLFIAAVSVPANLVFGLAASWAIARFRFPGKDLLISLIDLPFSVSPVIAGMV